MKYSFLLIITSLILSCAGGKKYLNSRKISNAEHDIIKTKKEFWLTKSDQTILLQEQKWDIESPITNPNLPRISIDPKVTYQSIDGFGFNLTGGSSDLIYQLPEKIQNDLLNELFAGPTQGGIRINYLRITLGASDLSASIFSYNDLPSGQENDPDLKNFSLARDLETLIPVLKKIIKINPTLKILASPWSPPLWMKTNKNSIGGKLNPIYYPAYAKYFVKYIKAMREQGIIIDAITPQNEPLNEHNNPSTSMSYQEQAEFIKNYLGPAFRNENIATKINIYDHNCDHVEYPMAILQDPKAAEFINGSAFHLYGTYERNFSIWGGDVSCLSKVKAAFPDKEVSLTEFWVGGPSQFSPVFMWHMKHMIIGGAKNWAKSVLEWNLAASSKFEPHTKGGCETCEGALSIDSDKISRNVAYYIVAHASKFVDSGSIRIGSESSIETLSHVAFKTTDNKNVLIVLNEKEATEEFAIEYQGKLKKAALPAKSVGTFVWEEF